MRYFILVIVAVAYLAYVSSDSCVQCDSSNNAHCATNPERFMAKECITNSSSLCYTRVLNGNTIRGCASDLDNATASNCANEMECLICSFMEGCNRNVFPRHRVTCLQCQGNTTGYCATDVYRKPTVCPIYQLGDKCYIRNNGKNNTDSFQRGCLSTVQKEKKLCVKEGNCYTCEGPGCNLLTATAPEIPMARDSASTVGYSVALLVMAAITRRFI